MNYVKRFIPLIITGVVTLILTIVLVVLVLKEQKNVDDLEAKVKGNRNKK